MVLDSLNNKDKYMNNESIIKAIEFIKKLAPESEEKKYEIDGDKIFAMVMSYPSKSRTEAVLESHKKYVDVQSTLAGTEGMEWFPANELSIETAYCSDKDVMFYEKPKQTRVRFSVNPGEFAIFFPTDAHMPQLMSSENPTLIKKVVVKISVDLVSRL